MSDDRSGRVAIVGGGLAGLAAAVALGQRGLRLVLFESRSRLGGRATSFRDAETDETVDHCQHVSLGCCTNLDDFCWRTGIAHLLRRDRTLYFFGPDGRRCDFRGSTWLPAPLHLAPALFGLKYLKWSERLSIAHAMLRLARLRRADCLTSTIGQWLHANGQTAAAISTFWNPVLVSALSETVDRASLWYARKVFVDGFMATRQGYEILVPRVPLSEFYGQRILSWLAQHDVEVRLATPVRSIAADFEQLAIEFGSHRETYDSVICAVPWRAATRLLDQSLRGTPPDWEKISQIEAVPITGIHLWFDRPITHLPHAVLIDRLGQWLFRRETSTNERQPASAHYYQIVISASRPETVLDREALVRKIQEELAELWPAASQARLLRWRVITEPEAVFSVAPQIDAWRPGPNTAHPGLMLAGDWTLTGWPATMEGAVRSGYRAAEALLDAQGCSVSLVVPELRPEWLARRLIGTV